MAAKTWTQTSGNLWSNGANWNGGTVPATTDTVTFDVTSVANCTIDALGTWSGGTFTIASTYSGVITQNSGINITTAAYAQAAGTFTGNAAATFTSTTFAMTAGTFNQGGAFVATTFTVNTGSPSFQGSSATMSTTAVTFGNSGTIRGTSGTWTLAGSWTQSGASTTYTHNSGIINITAASTFNDARSAFNNVTVNAAGTAITFSVSTTVPLGATPTVTSGSLTMNGIITWSGTMTLVTSLTTGAASTLTGTSTPTIALSNLDMVINAGTTFTNTVDITLTISTSAARTMALGGKTYGTFRRTGAGVGDCTITGSNTFTTLRSNDGTITHNLIFTAGTTQTLTNFTVAGISGKPVTIKSTSVGSAWTMTSAGNQTASYTYIQDSTVNASPIWTADATCMNGGGNTNWVFASASGGGGSSGNGSHQGDCRRYRRRY